MAGVAGLEPAHDGIKIRCLTAWLHPNKKMGWVVGIEPTTSRATIWHANQLRYTHHSVLLAVSGAPEGSRTPDTRLRRPLLYPAELLAHRTFTLPKKAGAGDGNRTHAISLEGWDSTIELHPHMRPSFSKARVIILLNVYFVNDFFYIFKIGKAHTKMSFAERLPPTSLFPYSGQIFFKITMKQLFHQTG